MPKQPTAACPNPTDVPNAAAQAVPSTEEETLAAYGQDADRFVGDYEEKSEPPLEAVYERWLVKGAKILELGCGSGRDARWLAALGMRVLATDGSGEMLTRARDLAQGSAALGQNPLFSCLPLPVSASGLKDAQDVLAHHRPDEDSALPFTAPFDAVLAVGVLQHLSDEALTRTASFLEASLSTAGTLIVSVPIDHPGDKAVAGKAKRHYFARPASAYSLLLDRFGLTEVWRSTQEKAGAAGRECTWATMVFLKDESRRRARTNLTGILETDRKTTSYKYALVRSLCDINIQSSALVRYVGGPAEGLPIETVAIPLALVIERVISYYWQIFLPSLAGGASPSQIQSGRMLGIEAKLKDLMSDYCGDWHNFREEFYSGAFTAGRSDARYKHFSRLLSATADALVDGPIKYAGNSLGETAAAGTRNRLFTVRPGKGPRGSLTPRDLAQRYGELLLPADIWKELNYSEPSMADSVLVHWARYSANAPSNPSELDLGKVIEIMLPPDQMRNVGIAKSIYDDYPGRIGSACVWTGNKLTRDSMHIDHMLPWSRLHNNDLWNLVPASKNANLKKSDLIPSNDLLYRSRHRIIDAWRFLDAAGCGPLLRAQAENVLTGSPLPETGWQGRLFDAVLAEADLLARQYGAKRWDGVPGKAAPTPRPSPVLF